MLATTDKTFEHVADSMHRALADIDIRLKCEAKERYERDRISLYASGHLEGLKEGIERGIEQGIEKGIEKGQLKERASIIQNLATKGMSADDIASLLDLTPAEVENNMAK